jgi:hypothetical protein
MTKFTKTVIWVGILALVPLYFSVYMFTWTAAYYNFDPVTATYTWHPASHDPVTAILVVAAIYAPVGVVIVAPAWVLQQVLIFLAKHAIIHAFRGKKHR